MKYWLQTKAPAGNWVDSLGTMSIKSARDHGKYLQSLGNKTRIIERKDTELSGYIEEQEKQQKTFMKKNPANKSGIRVVYNKMLGGWYLVRGPHQTPLNGRFDTKQQAQEWLQRKREKRNPAKYGSRSEVRSPTSTRSEVRSPTRTSTSTKADTRGNVTVTGGAGDGNTSVTLRRNPRKRVIHQGVSIRTGTIKRVRRTSNFARRRNLQLKHHAYVSKSPTKRRAFAQNMFSVREKRNGVWFSIAWFKEKNKAIVYAKAYKRAYPSKTIDVVK